MTVKTQAHAHIQAGNETPSVIITILSRSGNMADLKRALSYWKMNAKSKMVALTRKEK